MTTPFWGHSRYVPAWATGHYLISAASLWRNEQQTWRRPRLPEPSGRMFLDSGGYSFFARWGDYPFSPDQYLDLVQGTDRPLRPLIWASLDYPCEPETERGALASNADRIEATVDKLSYLHQRAAWPGLMPVVQGYSLTERLFCLEQMSQRGLTRPYMAIGSLCAMRNTGAIVDIVRGLDEAAPAICGHPVEWHLFGVKIGYFYHPRHIRPRSFDTAAWGMPRRMGQRDPRPQRQRFEEYLASAARALANADIPSRPTGLRRSAVGSGHPSWKPPVH
jgi:hypothetical protein